MPISFNKERTELSQQKKITTGFKKLKGMGSFHQRFYKTLVISGKRKVKWNAAQSRNRINVWFLTF